jgi:hypothetical protein
MHPKFNMRSLYGWNRGPETRCEKIHSTFYTVFFDFRSVAVRNDVLAVLARSNFETQNKILAHFKRPYTVDSHGQRY